MNTAPGAGPGGDGGDGGAGPGGLGGDGGGGPGGLGVSPDKNITININNEKANDEGPSSRETKR